MKSIKLLLLLVISAALILTGCPSPDKDDDDDLDIDVTGVDITNSTASLLVGATLQLGYTMTPDDANTGLTWSSSADGVATVNQSGLVTGVALGEATITLASTDDPSIDDTCEVTVTALIEELDDFFLYNQDSGEITEGTTTVKPALVDGSLVITNTSTVAELTDHEFNHNTLVLYNDPFTGQFRIRARVHLDDAVLSSSDKGITIGAYTESESTPGEFTNDSKIATMMMRTRTDINAYFSKGSENGTGSPTRPRDNPNTLNEYIFEVHAYHRNSVLSSILSVY